MTPERNLIEAVLLACDYIPVGAKINVEAVRLHPTVQAALAKVRKEGVAIGAAYAFCPPASHTKPEPVLRWDGDRLWLGAEKVARIVEAYDHSWCFGLQMRSDVYGRCPTEGEARAAAEQAVRDWLARAGLVRQGGEVVEDHSLCHRPGCSLHDIPLGLASCACHFAHPPASPTAEVVEAIKHAIFVFDTYAENHTAKGTAEGHLKAERNRQEATRLRTALAKVQTNG